MDKIKAVIIDDESKAIDVIQRYSRDSEIIDVIATFRNPVKALEFVEHNPVQLIFLDINMPKISGLEFLNILNAKPKIIFTTAYSEYALDSYNYDTVDYLLKPIDFKRFLKAVTKAKSLLSTVDHSEKTDQKIEDKVIYIKSGTQLHKLGIDDILYLEKDGNYLTFYTKDKKILSRQNMKDVFEILDPGRFIRVHKSYVVALKHLDIIESHQVRIGEARIPVGRMYREELMSMIGKKSG